MADRLTADEARAEAEKALDLLGQEMEDALMEGLRTILLPAILDSLRESVVVAASYEDPWADFVRGNITPKVTATYQTGVLSGWIGREEQVKAATAVSATPLARVVDQRAVAHAAESSKRIVRMSHAVWGDARQTISDGIANGQTLPQITTALKAGFSSDGHGAYAARAEQIARTETTMAVNAGAMDSMEVLGVYAPKMKQWLATTDGRTRESHAEADGQTVPMDEPFFIGGYPMDYPGDPGGPVEEVVNCRCTVLFVDDPEEVSREGQGTGEGELEPIPVAHTLTAPAVPRELPERPWQSFPEARKYLEQAHPGIHFDDDMAGWDRRTVYDTAKVLDRASRDFPEEFDMLRYVGSQSVEGDAPAWVGSYGWENGAYAHACLGCVISQGEGYIGINPKFAQDWELWGRMKQQGNFQSWTFGSTPEDTIAHEFGHIWHGAQARKVQVAKIAAQRAGERVDVMGFGRQLSFATGTDWGSVESWLTDDYMRTRMKGWGSEYGAKNRYEAVAESFSAAWNNPDKMGAKGFAALRDLTDAARPSQFAVGSMRDPAQQLEGLKVIDRILRSHGIRARPPGFAAEMARLAG